MYNVIRVHTSNMRFVFPSSMRYHELSAPSRTNCGGCIIPAADCGIPGDLPFDVQSSGRSLLFVSILFQLPRDCSPETALAAVNNHVKASVDASGVASEPGSAAFQVEGASHGLSYRMTARLLGTRLNRTRGVTRVIGESKSRFRGARMHGRPTRKTRVLMAQRLFTSSTVNSSVKSNQKASIGTNILPMCCPAALTTQ